MVARPSDSDWQISVDISQEPRHCFITGGQASVSALLTRMFLAKQRASFLATLVCLGPRQTFIALCVSYLSAKRQAFLTRHFL